MNKRGLSPVIATVLLVSLAVVVAFLIFIWAKGTIAEKYLKFNEPVERSCGNAVFDLEISPTLVATVNRGNVPIYGYRLYKQTSASITNLTDFHCMVDKLPMTIRNGESCEKAISGLVSSGEKILVVPIILSQRGEEYLPYTCENSFGKTVTVK